MRPRTRADLYAALRAAHIAAFLRDDRTEYGRTGKLLSDMLLEDDVRPSAENIAAANKERKEKALVRAMKDHAPRGHAVNQRTGPVVTEDIARAARSAAAKETGARRDDVLTATGSPLSPAIARARQLAALALAKVCTGSGLNKLSPHIGPVSDTYAAVTMNVFRETPPKWFEPGMLARVVEKTQAAANHAP